MHKHHWDISFIEKVNGEITRTFYHCASPDCDYDEGAGEGRKIEQGGKDHPPRSVYGPRYGI